jgi:hypothetical protein
MRRKCEWLLDLSLFGGEWAHGAGTQDDTATANGNSRCTTTLPVYYVIWGAIE